MTTATFGKPTVLLGGDFAHKGDFTMESTEETGETGSLESFEPTGLLGSSIFGKPSGPLGTTFDEEDDLFTSAPNSSFKPNGLLGSDLFSSLKSVEDDDDEFPPLSSILGPPRQPIAQSPENPHLSTIPQFSVRAKTFDGKLLYIKRKTKVSRTHRNNLTKGSSERIGQLLDIPLHQLMDSLSRDTAEALVNPIPVDVLASSHVGESLWVDRYRPQRFTELLGNERVARETMAWVKQWDWCVFGKGKGKKRATKEDGEYEDEYHRPRERLLLLSGPPGLGKTTLAQVVAKQAGYDLIEINASDARSGQIIDERIRPTLEAGSAIGSKKPALLVIDEIDGATGAGENSNTFIQKLIQLTFDKPRNKKSRGPKDPNAKRPLLRPIICICNDINASSLSKLRPIALQLRMQRPADIHTVRRLREVCDLEGMKADARALSALVGVARGDLRGCLNTLQFIKSRQQNVTEQIVRRATVGMKETDASIMSVLNDLFHPLPKKRVNELGLNEESELRYVSRLSREVDSCGKDATVATACFSHYVNLRQYDANFSRHEKASEWLVKFDTFSSAMYVDGDFALAQYLPYFLVAFYPLFQERGGKKIERSSMDWDSHVTTRSNEEIYKSLGRCLQTASTRRGGDYRHLVNTPIIQLEFVPYINRIISPPLKPVNSQIIKPTERALMMRLVTIMASLELRFIQERGEDGQLSYRLDPPIDVFITYDGKRTSDIAVSRYAVRHLVAGEVDAKLMNRPADVVEKGKKGKHSEYFGRFSGTDGTLPNKRPADSEPGDHPNKKLKSDLIDIADKPPTDFFGRLIQPTNLSSSTEETERKPEEKKYRVVYKFKEGNSSAVRKPVKISTFL